ncbi:unnamed protein product [Schistosoma curassoni]|uniref:Reverse transcriptase domain-containing protein n=1 Tax=Schistosoma curassoni TaxID=6186 RepID=A0A183KHL9_9TREM|nr:unnamed protein product [Schistosoma curassoni]
MNKKTAMNNSRTRTKKVKARAEYTEANKQMKRSIIACKQKYMEELAAMAEKAAREGNMKQLYDTTKKLAGKYSKTEQRNRRVEYFEEILNRPAPLNLLAIKSAHTDLPIDDTPQTSEEIRMAIRQIKSGKAAGPDNIPVEALK